MKNNIIILFAVGLFSILGCEKFPVGNDFLAKAPGVDVTKDTVFSNLKYAERFLWNSYSTLRYGLNTSLDDWGSVLGWTSTLEDITDLSIAYSVYTESYIYNYGTYNADTENGGAYTKYHYYTNGSIQGIRSAYIFLANIDRVPDVDPAYRKQLKAEALMIIACHYSDFYRNYGGVPWLSKAYSVTDDFSNIPRLTAQATCDSLVKLCDKAIADLPWTISNLAEWDGRFTKASAMGLKARILLFNASPLFNSETAYLDGEASSQNLTWHGGYDANKWQLAANAAHDLISQAEATGDYKLYHKTGNTYRQDFQEAYFTRGNGEVLISTRRFFKAPTAWDAYVFHYSNYNWGAGEVTDTYVEMFPMANGLPITDPSAGYDPDHPFFNTAGQAVRDPRLYETALVDGDSYRGRTAELWIGGRERTSQAGEQSANGYNLRKFLLDRNAATSRGSVMHWPFLRLAEIYLTYAEASNEFNGGPDAEAYRCVNIIRNRVGLGNLPSGLTRDQFREAVIMERALEFGFEEVRWFDLVRWKRVDDFTKDLHGRDIFRTGTAPDYIYTRTQTTCPPRYWQTNWSPKWYLSAFPTNELNKAYGLIQNPGW
jgi:hypothetical protein